MMNGSKNIRNFDKQTSFTQQVVRAIQSVTGLEPAGLHEPKFSGNEWRYVKESLDSTFVSSNGKFVDRFEEDLAAFTGAKHVIAVSSGTAALHIALKLAGVKEDDEVLVPALTFVATANAVSYCGATPHFVDSDSLTLGVDPNKLHKYLKANTHQINGCCVNIATGKVIRALIPMHTFGHPSDMDRLLQIEANFNITLVEDAAEALAVYIKDVTLEHLVC